MSISALPSTPSHDDLSMVLAKAKEDLTDEDISVTVAYLRSQRAKFAQEELEKATKPKKEKEGKKVKGEIDLTALGF